MPSAIRIVSALAVVLLAACGRAPEPGVLVDGKRIPVIDMHLHTGTWAGTPPGFRKRLSDRVPTGFKWTMGLFVDYNLRGETIAGQLDKAGISAGGLFAVYSPPTTGIAGNEFVAGEIASAPGRFYGFASLRIDDWNNNSAAELARLEAGVNMPGMYGIKVAHGHQQFRFDDRRFDGIYEICGRLGKPAYLHTGTSPNPGTRTEPPYADPAYLEGSIQAFPECIFILGHSGYDSHNKALNFTDSSILLAQKYDNVYLEPGALGAERAEALLPDYLRRIKDGKVVDKLIYGSDGPQFPGYVKSHLEAFVAGMKDAGYTAEEMEQILSGNFLRVFRLPAIQPGATK
ncbi:MAG: amidohydrolase family protein [Gammaproteobacteria bacterium]